MTNGDKLRAMSDEDLAEFIMGPLDICAGCPVDEQCSHARICQLCINDMCKWLKEEAKDD